MLISSLNQKPGCDRQRPAGQSVWPIAYSTSNPKKSPYPRSSTSLHQSHPQNYQASDSTHYQAWDLKLWINSLTNAQTSFWSTDAGISAPVTTAVIVAGSPFLFWILFRTLTSTANNNNNLLRKTPNIRREASNGHQQTSHTEDTRQSSRSRSEQQH